ncbi:MAG: hypothetical protein WEB00_08055 [Dehalococcoidia bacterium]
MKDRDDLGPVPTEEESTIADRVWGGVAFLTWLLAPVGIALTGRELRDGGTPTLAIVLLIAFWFWLIVLAYRLGCEKVPSLERAKRVVERHESGRLRPGWPL